MCLSVIFNAAFIDASLQSLSFTTMIVRLLTLVDIGGLFMVFAHLLFVTIMIWSSSFKALTECDSMVFPFILYSCFGALWLNRVLLPAANIIPVFMPVFIFLD